MRYFFIGLFAGAFLSASPVFMYGSAPSLYAEWRSDLSSPQMTSPDPACAADLKIVCGYDDRIIAYAANGSVLSTVPLQGDALAAVSTDKKTAPLLYSLSGNGRFYATYQKTGSEIEFFNLEGDRFWKIRSQEYPHLSTNGRLVLLQNADLSRIDILNNNGIKAGDGIVTGRMCTVIAFAEKCDSAAVGFLDGHFYVISDRGAIIYRGSVPAGSIVKSIALSDNALRCAVHYGDGAKDGIMTVNIPKNKSYAFTLPNIHQTRTAVHISDEGEASIINVSRVLFFTIKGKVIADIPIDRQKPGHAAIHREKNLYLLSYRAEAGGSALIAADDEGNIVFRKSFPSETALDCGFTGNTAWAKGIESVYAWRME